MIHFFCALPCEAEPLIQYFKLTELKEYSLFRLFQSEDKDISLTITGIGKSNASAAVAYHHGCLTTSPADIWLNIGIAGHASLPVGEACIINKITDLQHSTNWYPQVLFNANCTSIPLVTLDTPSTDYQETLIDMEAAGFYSMALRLGTAELIHCLKIVSDNQDNPATGINADNVKKLIASHKPTIEHVINELTPLADELNAITAEPKSYKTLIGRHHFTKSEQVQLSRLLKQWHARMPEKDILQIINDLTTGKAVIQKIQAELKEANFCLYD